MLKWYEICCLKIELYAALSYMQYIEKKKQKLLFSSSFYHNCAIDRLHIRINLKKIKKRKATRRINIKIFTKRLS